MSNASNAKLAAPALVSLCWLATILVLCGQVFAGVAATKVISSPVNIVQTVNGVSVTIPVRAESVFQIDGDTAHVDIEVIGGLADLEAKIGAIVDALPLPRENCRSYSANNPVVTLSRPTLSFQEGDAVLLIKGAVTMWDCRENPVPNSKVEFKEQNLGLGIKTKVPIVTTWPGSPIKNVLASQSFEFGLPAYFEKVDDKIFAIKLVRRDTPDTKPDDAFAKIKGGVLSIAGVNANDRLQDTLTKLIDPQKLLLTLPGGIRELPLKVTDPKFALRDDHLAVIIDLSGDVAAGSVEHIKRSLASMTAPEQ